MVVLRNYTYFLLQLYKCKNSYLVLHMDSTIFTYLDIYKNWKNIVYNKLTKLYTYFKSIV